MNDSEWTVYLDTLSPDLRALAQTARSFIGTLLDRDRSRWIIERQQLEQQIMRSAERSDSLHQTLDDMIGQVQELEARVTALEQSILKEREHGDGA